MTPIYTAKLSLITQKTSIRAQKIDFTPLETYSHGSADFLLQDSLETIRFFEEPFLLANTSMEVVLQISFLSFNNTDIKFAELEKLT